MVTFGLLVRLLAEDADAPNRGACGRETTLLASYAARTAASWSALSQARQSLERYAREARVGFAHGGGQLWRQGLGDRLGWPRAANTHPLPPNALTRAGPPLPSPRQTRAHVGMADTAYRPRAYVARIYGSANATSAGDRAGRPSRHGRGAARQPRRVRRAALCRPRVWAGLGPRRRSPTSCDGSRSSPTAITSRRRGWERVRTQAKSGDALAARTGRLARARGPANASSTPGGYLGRDPGARSPRKSGAAYYEAPGRRRALSRRDRSRAPGLALEPRRRRRRWGLARGPSALDTRSRAGLCGRGAGPADHVLHRPARPRHVRGRCG